MKVQICQGNAIMTDGEEKRIQARLQFALARLVHRIRSVRVQFDDLNGPRGGIDKRCTIEAVMNRRGLLVVEVTDDSIVTAVARAARKLTRRVSDQSQRSRDLRRRDSGTWERGNEQ